VKFGKKVTVPKTSEIKREKNRVTGPTWSVERVDGKVFYEYMSGELAGGIKRYEISEEDFAAVYAGEMTDYDLLLKYNLS